MTIGSEMGRDTDSPEGDDGSQPARPPLSMRAPPATVPMPSRTALTTRVEGAPVLLFLPSAFGRPVDLIEHGFVDSVQRAGVHADVVIADAHIGYYHADIVVERLHRDVLAPMERAAGRPLWLVGVSLGCVGAMLYAADHPEVTGVVAIAPWLGSRDALARVRAAGGWRAWDPADADGMLAWEHRVHRWLHERFVTAADAPGPRPRLLLATARGDRFGDAQRLLAAHLPPADCQWVEGGHDWPAWKAAWDAVLEGHGHQIATDGGSA